MHRAEPNMNRFSPTNAVAIVKSVLPGRLGLLHGVLIGVFFGQAVAVSARADDWPDWRGPMQDRHYHAPQLVTSFDPETGTNVLWKNDEAGGISTPGGPS